MKREGGSGNKHDMQLCMNCEETLFQRLIEREGKHYGEKF